MNTNAKIALGMAVPAVGVFVGAMMLRGPQAGLGGTERRRSGLGGGARRREWCFTEHHPKYGAQHWGPFSTWGKADLSRKRILRDLLWDDRSQQWVRSTVSSLYDCAEESPA